MIVDFVSNAFYELFPFPRLLIANNLVARGSTDADTRKQRWAGLGRTRLLELLVQEWERAKHLDDKLFKATTGLSVAVSAAGVASKSVLDALSPGTFKVVITGALLYAIASLFAGVIMGFKGLRPKQRPGYGPDFAVLIRRESRSTSREIADALMHFEIKNLIVSNEATAANMAMRNGVIAFAIAMTVSLFIPAKVPTPVPQGIHYMTVLSTANEPAVPSPLDAPSTQPSPAVSSVGGSGAKEPAAPDANAKTPAKTPGSAPRNH